MSNGRLARVRTDEASWGPGIRIAELGEMALSSVSQVMRGAVRW